MLILAALLNEERTPLGIVEVVNRQSGRKTLSRGSIYVLLGRLEDAGLIAGIAVEDTDGSRGGRATRRYRLTGLGQQAVDEVGGLFESGAGA